MGFGSYDESDQRDPEITAGEGDEEDVDLRQHDHHGTATFESGATADELVDRLGDILEADEDGDDDEEE